MKKKKNKKKNRKNPFDSYMKKYHKGGTIHTEPHTDDPYTTDQVIKTKPNQISSTFAWGNNTVPDFSDQTKTNNFQGEVDPLQTTEGGATEDTGWMSMLGGGSGSAEGGGGMDTASTINAATGAVTDTMGQIAGLIQLASQKYGDDPILTETTNKVFGYGGLISNPNMFALGGMMGTEKAELEGGEGIVGLDGNFREVKGKSHEQGGEIYDVIPQDQPFTDNKQVKPGEEIFSKAIKIANESAAKREKSRFKQEEKSKENYESNPNIFSKASLEKTILNRQIGGELDKKIQKDVRETEEAKKSADGLLKNLLKMNEITSKFSKSKKKSKKDVKSDYKYKKGGKVDYKYNNGGKVKGKGNKEDSDIYKVPDLKLDLHKQQDNVKSNDNAKLNLIPGALEGSLSYNNKGLSLEAKAKQDYINLLQEGKLKNPELDFSASYGDETFDISGNLNTNFEDVSGNINANIRPSDKVSAYGNVNLSKNPNANLGVNFNANDKLNLGANAQLNKEGVNVGATGNYQLNPNTNLNAYLNYGKTEDGNYEPTFGAGVDYTFDRNKENPDYVYKHGGEIPMYQTGGNTGWPPPGFGPLVQSQFPLLFARGQPRLSNLDPDPDDVRDFSSYFKGTDPNNKMFPYGPYGYAGVMSNGPEVLMNKLRRTMFNNPVESIETRGLSDDLLNKYNTLPNIESNVGSVNKYNIPTQKTNVYDSSEFTGPIEQGPKDDFGQTIDFSDNTELDPIPFDILDNKIYELAPTDYGNISEDIGENNLSPITTDPTNVLGNQSIETDDESKDVNKLFLDKKIPQRYTSIVPNEIDPITGRQIPLDINPELLKAPVLNLTETEKTTEDPNTKEKKNIFSDFTTGDQLGMLGTGIGGVNPMLTTLMQQAATPKNKSFFETYMDRALGTMEGQKGFLGQQKAKSLKDVRLASDTFNRDTRRNVRSINTLRALGQLSNAQEQKMTADIYSNYAQQMMGLTGQIAQMQGQQDMVKMGAREKADLANRQDMDAFFTNLNQDQRNLGTMLQKMGKDLNVKKSDQDFLSILPQLNKYGISMQEKKDGGYEMFDSRTGKTATQARLNEAKKLIEADKNKK
jgi:hypothetical protein